MAKTNIYLNFKGKTEEAFNLYKSVFKTDWAAPIMRMGDMPPQEGMPQLSADEKNNRNTTNDEIERNIRGWFYLLARGGLNQVETKAVPACSRLTASDGKTE